MEIKFIIDDRLVQFFKNKKAGPKPRLHCYYLRGAATVPFPLYIGRDLT